MVHLSPRPCLYFPTMSQASLFHAGKIILLTALLGGSLGGCSTNSPAAAKADARPAAWAQPLHLAGLPNAYKVDDNLYRGAQPTAEGLRQLKAMGVRTIVNLRSSNTDASLVGDTGLSIVWIPMQSMQPSPEADAQLLRVLADPSRGPFFVHCRKGADRTGQAMAIYRIAIQGWERQAAIDEMRQGGYGFSMLLPNLITYVRSVDIQAMTPARPMIGAAVVPAP